MAIKFLYYFLSVFAVIMLFLLYQKPYNIPTDKNSKDRPSIEITDMVNYSINTEGISYIVKATKVLRFTDRDEFYNIDATRKSKKIFLENLKANSGILIKDNLKLKGSVEYQNSDNIKFKSQKLDYNLKEKVFRSDVDFILEDSRSITHGSSIVYKSDEGKIYANNIKSIIEEKHR